MNKKKKLLYIMRYDLTENFNLKMKFDGQLASFRNLGFDVYYIGFDRKFFYLIHGKKKKKIGRTHFKVPGYVHTLFYVDLNRMIGKLMMKTEWTVVYWRGAPCWFTSYRAAVKIRRNHAAFIYEFPTFTYKREKQLNRLREAFFLYSDHWQKKLEREVSCFVMIGADAGGSYRGKPAVNLSNGVSMNLIPLKKSVHTDDAIHILCLASMSYWHGYDRLIRSLAQYDGDTPIVIHMVGGNSGGSLEDWKKLTEELHLGDKVIFHGQKTGKDLDELFDLCDIGVNSLGMYRKGLEVTSELKSREYAARGLPFICTVQDPALEETDDPMWLKLSNDDTIPDMNEIAEFALKMRDNPDINQRLRRYASEHMTWEAQYKKVFELLSI